MDNLKIKDFKITEHPIKYEGSNSLFLHGQTIIEVLNENGNIEVTQKNEAELKSIVYELLYNYYC